MNQKEDNENRWDNRQASKGGSSEAQTEQASNDHSSNQQGSNESLMQTQQASTNQSSSLDQSGQMPEQEKPPAKQSVTQMTESVFLAAKAKNYFQISGIISFAIIFLMATIGTVVLFVSLLTLPPWWLIVIEVLLLAWLAYFMISVYPTKKYQRTKWRFDEQGLYIQQGIWWRKQYAVPRSRVQHIDVTQGPLQRNYNIAQLILHTAGTMNASVSLTGLSHEKAVEIRDELLIQEKYDAV